jgi:hypothetical protein
VGKITLLNISEQQPLAEVLAQRLARRSRC